MPVSRKAGAIASWIARSISATSSAPKPGSR